MVKITLSRWLAKTSNLTTSLCGEILKETEKAFYIKGTVRLLESQYCIRCGREITNLESRRLGIGMECCALLGIPRNVYTRGELDEIQEALSVSTTFEKWFPKAQVKVEGEYTIPGEQEEKKIFSTQINLKDKKIQITTHYQNKDLCKSIQGASWNNSEKVWEFPVRLGIIKQILKNYEGKDYILDESIKNLLQEKVEVSSPTCNKLFPYQVDGVKFLIQNKRALLADEMGVGKTVQAIMAATEIGKKILVVCPSTLKNNWKREFSMWTPEWVVQIVDGDKKTRISQLENKDAQVFIVNWEVLRLADGDNLYHLKKLISMKFDVCIMDECHKIKNRKAALTKCSAELAKHIPYIFPLTGTPMMNAPGDLYPILNVLSPKEFKSYWKFVEKFCEVTVDGYGYKVGGLKSGAEKPLRELLSQFMLRRTKKEVLKDLPDKSIQQMFCTLTGNQNKIYREMADAMYTEFQGEVVNPSVVIAQITRLKQITIDPTLILGTSETGLLEGGKIDLLLEIMESLGDQKVVIFSQFAQVCKRLKLTLEEEDYKGTILVGEMDSKARDLAIQTFQTDPNCKFIVVSTLAGGVGITLTAASTAVFLDKYWTPAINSQAQDRLHRIGQKNAVNIIEILAEDTVEEYIEEILKYKYAQFTELFSVDNFETTKVKINTKDLIQLFKKSNK